MDNDTTPATTTHDTFEMVFTMGLPAAGKSWMAAIEYPAHDAIDPDAIKESHPAYNPSNPAALHAWSQEVVTGLVADAMNTIDRNYLIDGTGINTEKMIARMTEAKTAGYSVTLMFVTCNLDTSIARNAARARVVPEHIIRDKAENVTAAFETLRLHADTVRGIENN